MSSSLEVEPTRTVELTEAEIVLIWKSLREHATNVPNEEHGLQLRKLAMKFLRLGE